MSSYVRLSRADLARSVLAWAARTGRPLTVGNGFLAREVAAAGDGQHVLFLLAGMGLAPAVAAGVAKASGGPTAALEGDGNHLMGLAGTATIALHGLPVTHIVHWNGGWESTGGQCLLEPGSVRDAGVALGYAWSARVDSETGLRSALALADTVSGPGLIHVIGAMGEPAAARTVLSMPENARQFRSWLAERTPAPCT
jgi:thiamine pyrophosphate-dependent acetolactate synthase large subunit-like protein